MVIQLSEEQLAFVRTALTNFRSRFDPTLGNRVFDNIPSACRPAELVQFVDSLNLLQDAIDSKLPMEACLPTLKRVLMEERRDDAQTIERLKEQTPHPEIHEYFEQRLTPYNDLMGQDWFDSIEAIKKPTHIDYFYLEQVERLNSGELPNREYDEKFHILQAPYLFLKDLAFYRASCEMRGTALVIAYLDIDDFKALNKRHVEVKVDRYVLPIFMRCVEASVYHHGFGYRFGGDEYMLLLINMSTQLAVSLLKGLRKNISNLHYGHVDDNITISIGLCEINADSFLTDREFLEHANIAKDFAKDKGKDRIAGYRGPRLTREELLIIEP